MSGKKRTLDKDNGKLKLNKIAKKQNFQERGITLIALVVTIIILLILAGVTLNIALSDNGLFSKTKEAAEDYNKKSVEEQLELLYVEKAIENNENKLNVKEDVTSVLEEMSEGSITQEDIDEFNESLKKYNEKVIAIKSGNELANIGTNNEEYPIDGIYVQLDDIDEIKKPIGSEEEPFTGIYNGNGKVIKKIEISTNENYVGMFRKNAGIVENVTINDCNINSTSSFVGTITGENTGIIENCTISEGIISYKEQGEDITSTNNSTVGGICGRNNEGLIMDCENGASVDGGFYFSGGICGYNSGSGKIYNCVNKGVIRGPSRVGGIAGYSFDEGRRDELVEKCRNYGNITAYDKNVGNSFCGGITGACSRNYFKM